MASYLLTCNCGQTIVVDAGQSGGQVVCSCGNRLDVPTLRKLRHLPLAPTNQSISASSNWSVRKGVVTVFLIAAGLLVAASLWNWLTEPKLPVFQPQSQAEAVEQRLREVTPVDAWKEWIVYYRPLAEKGFVQLEASNAPQIRATIAHKRFLEATLLSVAGMCLAVAAIATMWPGGKKRGR